MENTAMRVSGDRSRKRNVKNAIQKIINTKFTIQADMGVLMLGATTLVCGIASAASLRSAFLLLYRATSQEFVMLAIPMVIVTLTVIQTSVLFARAIKLGVKWGCL